MSLTLTTYPVTLNGSTYDNVFAGFGAVEVEYKREDAQLIGLNSGVDNKVLLTISGDFSGDVNVGEWVYFYCEALGYTYDTTAKVLSIVSISSNTVITVDFDFIQSGSSGYVNYKQNYFVEGKLVSPTNNDVKVYPQMLSDSGTPAGVINLNCSPVVDFLESEILSTSGELANGRTALNLMYREVWRENQTESFILENDTKIVIIHTADNTEPEKFINQFETPKIWAGYPFILSLKHSTVNELGERYSISFDELDINQDTLTSANALHDFGVYEEGILQTNFNDNVVVLNANTKYIKFNTNSEVLYDFETGDFNDTDFLTINTP